MRILIVEDEIGSRRLLEVLLSPLGPCESCGEGESAVEAARRALEEGRPFELVCLDIQLGKMDGHAALKALRAAEFAHGRRYGQGARVVMTTSRADTRSVSSAFSGMCDAYLVKPVTPAKLQATLQELGVELASPAVIVHGPESSMSKRPLSGGERSLAPPSPLRRPVTAPSSPSPPPSSLRRPAPDSAPPTSRAPRSAPRSTPRSTPRG
jgi:two-component system chemotaxis response regulator CheY